jgi:hypothetical protein
MVAMGTPARSNAAAVTGPMATTATRSFSARTRVSRTHRDRVGSGDTAGQPPRDVGIHACRRHEPGPVPDREQPADGLGPRAARCAAANSAGSAGPLPNSSATATQRRMPTAVDTATNLGAAARIRSVADSRTSTRSATSARNVGAPTAR